MHCETAYLLFGAGASVAPLWVAAQLRAGLVAAAASATYAVTC